MLTRFEYNIQTGKRIAISQTVYRNDEGDTIVLDVGMQAPIGFTEFTGDLTEESPDVPAEN